MKFAIYLFDGAEPIDIATLGVLSIARRVAPEIEIFSLAKTAGIVHMANGFNVVAEYGFDTLPAVDVIVIVGGATWVDEIKSDAMLNFLRQRAENTVIGAVCTGAFLLVHTGMLDGKKATTRCEGVATETISPLNRMANNYPNVEVVHSSLVDQGNLVTGGGVCLCIDMMLHLLEKKLGSDVANEVARLLEYGRAWRVNKEALPPVGL